MIGLHRGYGSNLWPKKEKRAQKKGREEKEEMFSWAIMGHTKVKKKDENTCKKRSIKDAQIYLKK
jgi:hypothetical protein